jgi:hypothetical protein
MAASMLSDTQALGNPSVRMKGSENEWGFGQFLPVLLLALPVFAGWESFWEEKDDKDRDKEVDRFGRRNNRASRSNTGLLDAEKGAAAVTQREEGMGTGTPRLHDSLVNFSPLETPRLTVVSPAASPRLGAVSGGERRPRTPSRFEEDLR